MMRNARKLIRFECINCSESDKKSFWLHVFDVDDDGDDDDDDDDYDNTIFISIDKIQKHAEDIATINQFHFTQNDTVSIRLSCR